MKKRLLSTACALVLLFASAAPLAENSITAKFGISASAETLSDSNFTYNVRSDGTLEIKSYKGAGGAVTIPSSYASKSITRICDNAFEDCDSITSVTIPDSVTVIGDNAFSYCDFLKKAVIGNGVKFIGWYAFYKCYGLSDVTIGNSVEDIGMHAFYCCESLTNVVIPNSVRLVGNYAFYKCTSLKSITVPKSVEYIGNKAFGFTFDDGKEFMMKDFTLKGYTGSVAETYASENGVPFSAVDARKKGDVVKNNKIDNADLLAVKSHIKKIKTLTGEDLRAADVDGSGAVNNTDLIAMKAHIKGVKNLW